MATSAAYIDETEGAAPATPAAGKVRIYAKTDGLIYSKDDAGVETLMSGGPGGGGVATDSIWDAAGDLAVGTGANTAARLAIGNAGGAVSRVNGAVAWNSGTAFPTAATGDRFWRTDLGVECYYDGTRWLSTQLHTMDFALTNAAVATGVTDANNTTTQGRGTVPYASTRDLYIVSIEATSFVGATNNGSNFWTIAFRWGNAAGTFTDIDSFTTAADTQANYTYHKEDVGSVLDNTAVTISITVTDSGTVGTLVIAGARLLYRVVYT